MVGTRAGNEVGGSPVDPARVWTIGLLSPLLHGFYFGGVLAGVVDAAGRGGGRVIAIQTADAGLQIESVDELPLVPVGWRHIDAFVVVQDAVPDSYLYELARAGKVIVLVSRTAPGLAAPTVVPDNNAGITAAVAHLVEHGHRRIAFAGRVGPDVCADDTERHRVYERAMLDRGLEPSLTAPVPSIGRAQSGRDAVRHLLAAPVRPTAIVACTDVTAINLITALREAGIEVPRDIAVTGFDDIEDAARLTPALTTVTQSFALVGRMAGDLALDALNGHPVEPGNHHAAVTLTVRESCGCTGPGDGAPMATTDASAGDRGTAGLRDQPAGYVQYQEQRRHYEISTDLLRRHNRDSRSLAWLSRTEVRAGCLALWAGGADRRGRTASLDIIGAYGEYDTYRLVGGRSDVREFPPVPLLDLLSDRPGDVLFLLSMRFDGSDWGLLALVGPLEMCQPAPLEMFNHWAVLLAVAFDQERAVRSVVDQREHLVAAHQRERALMEEIRISEERYALAADAANDGLWDWNVVTGVTYYSARWKSLLGYADEQVGTTPDEWLDRVHPHDRKKLERVLARQRRGRASTVELEYRMRASGGAYRWMLTRARSVRDDRGRVLRLVGSMTDITERKLLEDRLRHDALHDGLTGLPNRALLLDRLNQAIRLARRHADYWFAVLFLDLDGFKVINDSLGHQVGDEVLIQVANRLSGQLRENDTIARFGGDEYVILLNGVGAAHDLTSTVDRILSSFSKPFVLGERALMVSAAGGVAVCRSGHETADELLRDADTAMYRAKSMGNGASLVFDESMHADAMTRLQVGSDLRDAVAAGQFQLHYQPIVKLRSGRLVGVEALIRWNHPTRGTVPPAEFLPVAESTGLILQIGRWTIDEVCRQVREWRDLRLGPPELAVSVNLSNQQFWDPDLVNYVRRSLREHGIPPSAIVFEVTEGVIMHNPDAASGIMCLLRDDSIKLHVDDFGTGYSSLAALHRFPIDALKIDKSFVSRMVEDPRSRELVRTMIAMGRTFELDVIAEGIETEEQAVALAALSCRLVQGYLFSRPLPAAEMSRVLGDRVLKTPVRGGKRRTGALAG